ISMLGAASQNPTLIEFLQQESEGNPFFIVEILRALAEESGALDAIVQRRLPEHILTGGVRTVLERRINQTPSWARPLLELSAVAGRVIDVPMLTQSAAAKDMQGYSVDVWLSRCADLSIFEVHDQRWRFAHDKLRDCVLKQLQESARLKTLHRDAALAL